jgi:hypothetical protein
MLLICPSSLHRLERAVDALQHALDLYGDSPHRRRRDRHGHEITTAKSA